MEKLWPESVIVCLGSGPSLTQADVDFCRGRALVIAIKDTIDLCPWADVLYGCGADAGGQTWWRRRGPSLPMTGLRYSLDEAASEWASVLKYRKDDGLETDPGYLALGGNSGYQAVNLSVHLGARKVVLLGYDMQKDPAGRQHYFGDHPRGNQLPFDLFLFRFPTIMEPLKALGVELINASRQTALTCVPRGTLQEALA